MIITDINPQKKKGRYNLFVDGEFYSGINAEAIVKYQIKIGLELSKQQLDEIVLESETRAAFDKLISIVSRQMYTKFEIKQKLLKYGFNEAAVLGAINKAEEYHYIDDELYAKLLVESKNKKSKLEVKSLLYKKGIKNSTIEEQIKSIDEDKEMENALSLADKYMKNKEINAKNISNLYAFLFRKGYNSESISYAIKKYKCDDFEV